MGKQRKPRTRNGVSGNPEPAVLVLPKAIASTGAPSRIAVANTCGLGLDSWQKRVSGVLWAKRKDGSLASDTVCLSIARQAGKTYLVLANVLAECLISEGTTVAWTAHHNKVMLETFNSLKSLILNHHTLEARVAKINASAENRSVVFTNGSRIVFAARESGALRGVAKVRVLVIDEAQILSESAMADITPTQNQAVNPLTVMMGTPPKPGDTSDVWTDRRKEALAAHRARRRLDLSAWIEFSADGDAETDDVGQWRKANPSYVMKRTPLRAIRKLRRDLTEDAFRREALGIWSSDSTPAVIPAGVWNKLADEQSMPTSRFVLGVDVSPNRSVATVALAGLRDDGIAHVEVYATGDGVGWLTPWLVERCEQNAIDGIVIDSKGPAATLVGELKAKRLPVVQTSTDDMTTACAQFYDDATVGDFRHIGQPQLAFAVESARKRSIGDRWAWNRRTPDSDITPVVSATLALWGVGSRKVRKRRPKSNGGQVKLL